ncbi:MAG: kynureninase, partial [Candidatus Hodarchaeales archaeon]
MNTKLEGTSMEHGFTVNEDFARQLDKEDPLAKYRQRFYIPEGTIYADGNSLGLLSKDAEKSLLRVINEWKLLGIRGWLEAKQPWFWFGEQLGSMIAPIVGAKPEEVVATGTTTVNLHSLVSTFYHPVGNRKKIIADELNFPSDIYALKSQIKLHGLDPDQDLVMVRSKDGYVYEEEDIVELMTDEVALILLPSALYQSGQLLDMAYLAEKAREREIPIGFDCCHSIGAVPHYFDEWGVDFAFWCSYKYLNAGPGSTAFIYINEKHFDREPGLAGWFGYVKEKQFEMVIDFEHSKSAGGWQISSSNILCAGSLEGALNVTLEAGIDVIREKSVKMTTYLIYLVDKLLTDDPYNFKVVTPRDPEQRTGHIAIKRDNETLRICETLKTRGVIPDFRPPNIIRIAPVALYNTYHEIWLIV